MTPNPSCGRDIALASSASALFYAPQAEAANPAGLWLWTKSNKAGWSFIVNPAGTYQLSRYLDDERSGRSNTEQISESARLLLSTVSFHNPYVTFAAHLSRPVQMAEDSLAYRGFEHNSPLASHQNSLQASVRISKRMSFGGRIDRYYRYSDPQGEGYGYGVLFRPRGLSVGVQYQRFPGSGAQIWHPLDRRRDGTTGAALAWNRHGLTTTFQLVNLTDPAKLAYLEPHVGAEYRLGEIGALRLGGALFSRSERWAVTGGISLLDANLFREDQRKLAVPDEILQFSVAMIYRHRVPELGLLSLTTAWRF